MGEVEGSETRELDGLHEVVASPADAGSRDPADGPLRGILADIIGSLKITDEPEERAERGSDAASQGGEVLTEEERALRITRCIEHHLAYGLRIEDDDQRSRAFLNDTACIPIGIFHSAMRVSRQTHTGNFPPTAGQVIQAACNIEWERDVGKHVNPSGVGSPRWYRRMLAGHAPSFLTVAPGDVIKEIA
jgi:hypothetical protein